MIDLKNLEKRLVNRLHDNRKRNPRELHNVQDVKQNTHGKILIKVDSVRTAVVTYLER